MIVDRFILVKIVYSAHMFFLSHNFIRSLQLKIMILNKRLKIFINYFIGPLLFCWLMFSIYHQILQQKSLLGDWHHIFESFHKDAWWKLGMVILLMLVNWGLEAKKWQLLIKRIQIVSFTRAFRAIFSGQAFALNTVNGLGEYLGKAIYLEEGNRLRSIAVTIVGSISQVIVTFVMGLLGLYYIRGYLLKDTIQLKGLSGFWFNGLSWGVLLGTLVLIVSYFSLAAITRIIERIPFVSKYVFLIHKVTDFNTKELTTILCVSFFRYTVFVLQYLLLLQIFKVDAYWVSLVCLLCVMFLVLAIIPTVALAELGLRGELSILLIGLVSTNTVGILFTATGIWLINRVMPALLGSLFILGVKFFKK